MAVQQKGGWGDISIVGGVQISPGPPVLEYQKIWLLLLFSLFGALFVRAQIRMNRYSRPSEVIERIQASFENTEKTENCSKMIIYRAPRYNNI